MNVQKLLPGALMYSLV